jgi:hypothetical protein
MLQLSTVPVKGIHPARAADTGCSGGGGILAEGSPVPREQFVQA